MSGKVTGCFVTALLLKTFENIGKIRNCKFLVQLLFLLFALMFLCKRIKQFHIYLFAFRCAVFLQNISDCLYFYGVCFCTLNRFDFTGFESLCRFCLWCRATVTTTASSTTPRSL